MLRGGAGLTLGIYFMSYLQTFCNKPLYGFVFELWICNKADEVYLNFLRYKF